MRHLTLLLLVLALPAVAQDTTRVEGVVDRLVATAADPAALDAVWRDLVTNGQVPFREGGEAVFLFRGEARTVGVAGDHTGWRATMSLSRISGSDVWWRAAFFPEDARIDYKLIVDSEWILDPANPHIQVSGFGPNSELRMPAWSPAPETERRPGVPRGALHEETAVGSASLGYQLTIRVYTPSGYEAASHRDLPAIYFTDGHEYADDGMGAAVTILDNLIAAGRIPPVVAVFIDPRVGGENQREHLYLANRDFAGFVAVELVDWVDSRFDTRAHRDARTLVGTSFGGVFAAYLGATYPHRFSRLAVQSPALWVAQGSDWTQGGSLFDLLSALSPGALRVHLTAGTINDGAPETRHLRDELETGGQRVFHYEVNEGHSWGHWRRTLADAVEWLIGPSGKD